MMKCQECGTEGTGNFCRKCGSKLDSVEVARTGTELAIEQAELAGLQDQSPEATVSNVETEMASQNFSWTEDQSAVDSLTESNQMETIQPVLEKQSASLVESASVSLIFHRFLEALRFVGIAIVGIWLVFVGLISGLLFVLYRTFQQGPFFEDLLYHVLKNVILLPAEQAAHFSRQLGGAFWYQLVLLHGGEYRGIYKAATDSALENRLQFGFHGPLLTAFLLLFTVAASYMFLVRRLLENQLQSRLTKLVFAAGFSLLYGGTIVLAAYAFQPRAEFVIGLQRATLQLQASYGITFFVATFICFAGAWVGLGIRFLDGWQLWKEWVRAMRIFAAILGCLILLVSGLTIALWTQIDGGRLYSPHIITLGSVWEGYKHDPAVYVVLPNVMVQKLVYAVGGTWRVDNDHAARFLEAPGAFRLQLLTGVKSKAASKGTPLLEDLQQLGKEIRFSWVHGAVLLAYVFALSKITGRDLLMILFMGMSLAGGLALLAVYFSVGLSFSAGDGAWGRIGFYLPDTALALEIVTAVWIILLYGVRNGIAVRKRKGGGNEG